jgi:hypothetical protein
MYDAMDFQVRYDNHRRRVDWINDHDWQFERPERRGQLRLTAARALITLAALLAPATEQPRTAS